MEKEKLAKTEKISYLKSDIERDGYFSNFPFGDVFLASWQPPGYYYRSVMAAVLLSQWPQRRQQRQQRHQLFLPPLHAYLHASMDNGRNLSAIYDCGGNFANLIH